jgi:GTPase
VCLCLCLCVLGGGLRGRVCPIFQVSNVTGENLPLIRQFLNLLPSHRHFDADASPEFQIDDTFLVPVRAR